MWRCSSCGAQNREDYSFCSTCGTRRSSYNQQGQQGQQRQQTVRGSRVLLTWLVGAIGVVCIVLIIFLINNSYSAPSIYVPENTEPEYEYPATEAPGSQDTPEPVVPTVQVYIPTVPPAASMPEPQAAFMPDITSTLTPYGKVYWDYRYNGKGYSDEKIIGLISDTYYSRRNEAGEYYEGYSSGRNKENIYGYDFGFYYGDGVLYYAEVRIGSPAEILVKLYFWDGEIIAAQDYRGSDSELYMRGTQNCDRLAEEFSYVWNLSYQ